MYFYNLSLLLFLVSAIYRKVKLNLYAEQKLILILSYLKFFVCVEVKMAKLYCIKLCEKRYAVVEKFL